MSRVDVRAVVCQCHVLTSLLLSCRLEQETSAELSSLNQQLRSAEDQRIASVQECAALESRHQRELASERQEAEKRLAEKTTCVGCLLTLFLNHFSLLLKYFNLVRVVYLI